MFTKSTLRAASSLSLRCSGYQRSRRTQRGFSLISSLFALAIAAFILRGQIDLKATESKLQAGTLQGEILDNIKTAVNNYTLENYIALQNALPVTKAGITLANGITSGQSLAPTVDNLRDMGYLTPGYSANANLGSMGAGGVRPVYRVLFERLPAGCVGAACNMTGRVWIDQPIWRLGSTEIDGITVGALVRKLGADGMVATNANPARMAGPSIDPAGTVIPNPDAGGRAGIVAARVGSGTSGFGQYLTINDPRDVRFGGSLTVAGGIGTGTGTGAGGVTCNIIDLLTSGQVIARTNNCIRRAWMDGATGQVGVANAAGTTRALLDGTTGNISSMNAAGIVQAGIRYNGATGQSEVYGDNLLNNAGTGGIRSDGTVFGTTGTFNNLVINNTAVAGAACAPANSVVMGTVGGQPTLLTCSGGVWTSAGGVAQGVSGSACPMNGQAGVNSVGVQLFCVSNTWVSMADRMGKKATLYTALFTDNQFISATSPSGTTCPSGSTSLPFFYVHDIDSSKFFTNIYAEPTSGGWTARIKDGSGNGLTGTSVVEVACWFV